MDLQLKEAAVRWSRPGMQDWGNSGCRFRVGIADPFVSSSQVAIGAMVFVPPQFVGADVQSPDTESLATKKFGKKARPPHRISCHEATEQQCMCP